MLVLAQTSSVNNGIYVVSTGDWERAADFNGARDAVTGTLVIVDTAGSQVLYRVTTQDDPIVFGTSNITFLSAAFGDSSTVNFLQSGAGAVTRTSQSKMREIMSVTDFGATGDGVTNDRAAIALALTAATGKSLFFPDPAVGYRCSGAVLVIPTNTKLYGEGRESTRIFLDSNNNLFELGAGAGLHDLFLDGNSATGIGIQVTGTNGQQQITNVRATNFNGVCLNFASTTAGAGLSCVGCLMYQLNGAQGTGNYAIAIDDAVQLAAMPRKFVNLETGGNCSFSFGGSNSTYVANSFLSDLAYSNNSAAVMIVSTRIATVTNFTVRGGQNLIVGCDVYPIVTLGVNAGGCVIGPNAYNTTMPVDSSGNGTNLIYHWIETYTPTFTSSGVGAAIGNGTITGRWSRQGNMVEAHVQMVVGGTTNLGTGIFRFSLPTNAPNTFPFPQFNGACRMTNAGLLLFGVAAVPNGVNYMELQRDVVAGFSAVTPFLNSTGGSTTATFAAGDVFNASVIYTV